MSLKFDWR